MLVPIVIIVILLVAAVSVVMLAGRARAASTGALSRETRKRDEETSEPTSTEAVESSSTDLEATGRERSDETRTSSFGGRLARRRGGEVVEYEPVDEEEIGVSRRQFLNRGVLTAIGFGLSGFGAAMLGFLWPLQGLGGFGGTVNVGKLAEILAAIDAQQKPFYAAQARAYVVRYPKDTAALAAAKKVYKPAIYKDMSELGIVALYQRCVHLGCRVPFCQTSQWFECPCHGSKYSRVGEKKAGPAPRGLDRFYATQAGDSIIVDTGTIFLGPPIGTDTTGQNAEGPLCV
ncbi:MAG: Rieske 2Fe-2S domain-containing protein [Actinomycetota bacterium]|nr:Rieske 2Fe-2S domain-containing protein [Actinomycetota bacterium]